MLSDYRTLVAGKVQDTAGKLAAGDITNAILEAVKAYSRVRPVESVQTLTGDGAAVTFPLASDFEEGFSTVRSIEYPVDQQDPEYFDPEDDYQLYRDPATGTLKLRIKALTLTSSVKAYVAYTVRHTVGDGASAPAAAPGAALAGLGAGNVDAGAHRYAYTYVTAAGETELSPVSAAVTTSSGNGQVNVGVAASASAVVTGVKLYGTTAGGSAYKLIATLANTSAVYLVNVADGSLGATAPTSNTTGTTDTVPVRDRDAVASLATAICARILAAYYSQQSDSTMGVEAINYRTKGKDYLDLAKELERMYREQLGIAEGGDMVAAASVSRDTDVDLQGGLGDRFFHSRRFR